MTADERRDYIRKLVDQAPPLSPEIVAKLRIILAPALKR